MSEFNWDVPNLTFGQTAKKFTFNGGISVEGRELLLPLPPTENKRLILSRTGKRFVNSSEYNSWLCYAIRHLKKSRFPEMAGKVAVMMTCIFPDMIRRDIANYEKAFFDALTQSEHVYKDDSQVKFHVNSEVIVPGYKLVLGFVFPLEGISQTNAFQELAIPPMHIGEVIKRGKVWD